MITFQFENQHRELKVGDVIHLKILDNQCYNMRGGRHGKTGQR